MALPTTASVIHLGFHQVLSIQKVMDRMRNDLTQSPLVSPGADRSDTIDGDPAQACIAGHGPSPGSGMSFLITAFNFSEVRLERKEQPA